MKSVAVHPVFSTEPEASVEALVYAARFAQAASPETEQMQPCPSWVPPEIDKALTPAASCLWTRYVDSRLKQFGARETR